MKHFRFSSSVYLSLSLGLLIIILTTSNDAFSVLSLDRAQINKGQLWRLLTGNLVHFGWVHTLMNLAAFLLCTLALCSHWSLGKFSALLLVCFLGVGCGVYFLNPEYDVYAGMSGVIHGLIVAGLLLNKRHTFRINAIFTALLFAKISYEHMPGYQATELQSLLPVAVAYDAHLYGAIIGLLFGLAELSLAHFKRKI